MHKLTSDQKKKMINNCKGSLMHSIRISSSEIDVFSGEFIDLLRNYTFETQEDKDKTLKYFMDIVLNIKDLHNATHIYFDGPSTYKSLPLEQSIARGMLHPFSKEFSVNNEFPKWYLTAKVKKNPARSS